jgi:hypothetical protein
MSEEVRAIVESVRGLDQVGQVLVVAEQRLDEGDAPFVADLGVALVETYGSTDRDIRFVLARMVCWLALVNDPVHLEQALRLLEIAGVGDADITRSAASMLAFSRPAVDLPTAFSRAIGRDGCLDDLCACLTHELVIRGADVGHLPEFRSWATTSTRWARHPLRWLPLHRRPIEERADLPRFNRRGGGSLPSFHGADELPGTTRLIASADPAPAWVETTTSSAAAAIATAVTNWAEHSNGKIEARTFMLSPPTRSLADVLPALDLDCLRSTGSQVPVSIFRCSPADVGGILFAASSSGGAYGGSRYAAYGRLDAWRSMAGLCGAAETAAAADVEQQIVDHQWFAFAAPTEWFYQDLFMDIGIAALSYNGECLGVLAASDTD